MARPQRRASKLRRAPLANPSVQAAAARALTQELTLWAPFSAGACRSAVSRYRCAAVYMTCDQFAVRPCSRARMAAAPRWLRLLRQVIGANEPKPCESVCQSVGAACTSMQVCPGRLFTC
jgi:hypothetical protein